MAIRVYDLIETSGRIDWVIDMINRKRLEIEDLSEELSGLLKKHENILTGQDENVRG